MGERAWSERQLAELIPLQQRFSGIVDEMLADKSAAVCVRLRPEMRRASDAIDGWLSKNLPEIER